MLKVDVVRPDVFTGKAVYDLVKGTKYVHVAYTMPELVISIEGSDIPLKRIPAGGSGDIGFPSDIGGIDLPTSLGLYWPSADQSVPGQAWNVDYQAAIITSSFPIRSGGSQATIEAPIRDIQGLVESGPATIDALRSFRRPLSGGLNVAAHDPEFLRFADVIITPTIGPMGGTWNGVSGLFPVSGGPIGDRTIPRILECDVSILAVTTATCELMLTYWNVGDTVGPAGLNLSPTVVADVDGGSTVPGNDLAVILRPSVPVYNGSEKTIKRVAVSVNDTGRIFSMADLGGDRPYMNYLDPSQLGIKLYARSSGGGSMAVLVNWSWSEQPASRVI